jgi:hypothetical protein
MSEAEVVCMCTKTEVLGLCTAAAILLQGKGLISYLAGSTARAEGSQEACSASVVAKQSGRRTVSLAFADTAIYCSGITSSSKS